MGLGDCSPLDALSEILMDVPDLVFVYSLDGRYLFVNTAAARFLGADPLEVIGFHWLELGYPESVLQPVMDGVERVAATGEPVRHRLRTSPERGSLMLDLVLTPLRESGGSMLGVLAIGHDISEFFD